MEPTPNRFYCYGNVYISMGQDQAKTNQVPNNYAQNSNWGRGHCEVCDWTFSTPTSGLADGQEWLICADCRIGLDLASGKGPYKTRMCYWFQSKEGCPAGAACTFMHRGPMIKALTMQPRRCRLRPTAWQMPIQQP